MYLFMVYSGTCTSVKGNKFLNEATCVILKWWYRKDGGAEALAWQRGGKSGGTTTTGGRARGGQSGSKFREVIDQRSE